MADDSPMMRQYRAIKAEHRDEILFFRLGDFYEMFAEDALEVSSLLNLTLTSRNGVPMCGVPWHASRNYMARLLKLGKKIAVCEQVSDPAASKTLVERRVVERVSPGTATDEAFLERGSASYLAGIVAGNGAGGHTYCAFSYLELSSGEFMVTSFPLDEARTRLAKELERVHPRELIVQESLFSLLPALETLLSQEDGLVVNRWADWLFEAERCRTSLERQFQTASLKGFGFADDSIEPLAAGALLAYVADAAMAPLPHISSLHSYGESDFVALDDATQRNLELVRSQHEASSRYTLFEVLDETKTAMGQRLLKRRILQPLTDPALMDARLDRVETLYRHQSNLNAIRDDLSHATDLERLAARVGMDRAHAKDLVAVRRSLGVFFTLARRVGEFWDGQPGASSSASPGEGALPGPPVRDALESLRALLETALLDEPSTLVNEGKMIRPGYDATLDDLASLRDNGQSLLEAYLEEERAHTGIGSLKIKYNRVIGYFFEVSKTKLSAIPEHFIRRQSLSSGERFTTERLQSLESEIQGASERIVEREEALFVALRAQARDQLPALLAAARFLAELDVSQSLARAATLNAWVRPRFATAQILELVEARHPVVEAHLPPGSFVPNDLALCVEGNRGGEGDIVQDQTGEQSPAGSPAFALITGPNMAGKSTYLRQSALIVLMAQMGSFVPASRALIAPVDRIFCRVGASDNLARGESTFLVEMNETANILRNATAQSLVIMDEVGRGTGTRDGLSLAWAICEDLLSRLGCRTLFATHYHELDALDHPGLLRLCMDVREEEGGIVFLKRVKPGSAAESYGLHVARLAGIPHPIIHRAQEILASLDEMAGFGKKEITSDSQLRTSTTKGRSGGDAVLASGDTASPAVRAASWLEEALLEIDIDRLSGLKALSLLDAWQRELSLSAPGTPSRRSTSRRVSTARATGPLPPESPELSFDQ